MLLFRLNVTSKKSTCFKFVLISILNLISLKIFMISFYVLSVCGPVRFQTITSPSSLYRPVSSLSTWFANKERMYTPTSSHTSAPSQLPMVTSKFLGVFFFTHGVLLL